MRDWHPGAEPSALAQPSVTALVRTLRAIPINDERLKIISGDIMQADTVHAAVESQHAIVVTIGQGPTKKPVSMFLEGTKKVIAAMRQHGVEKLICVTGIKAGDSKGHGGFSYDKIFNPLLLKTIYADKDRQEALI